MMSWHIPTDVQKSRTGGWGHARTQKFKKALRLALAEAKGERTASVTAGVEKGSAITPGLWRRTPRHLLGG